MSLRTAFTRNLMSFRNVILPFLLLFAAHGFINAQSAGAKKVYEIVSGFQLNGGSAKVSGLTLKRDRGVMTFDGTFYFTAPMQGYVTGAVFVGSGTFHADVPPSEFERDNVKRMLGADAVDSDFKTAVLRFTDDTFDVIGKGAQPGPPLAEAQKLALEHDTRSIKEDGINYSARLAQGLLNGEPGVFAATFEGGRRGRFTFLFDPMMRIPSSKFGINAGEKVIIYRYEQAIFGSDVWLASPSEQDYKKGVADYSSIYELVDVTNYKMTLDLTEPKARMRLKTVITMKPRFAEMMAINFDLSENLSDFDGARYRKELHVKSVSTNGQPNAFIQESGEGGFTVFLNSRTKAGDELNMDIECEGDYIRQPETVNDAHYPLSNSAWYPRHGDLDRSTFEMKFLHTKKYKIAASGVRKTEEPAPEGKDLMQTTYVMSDQIALATFAMAPWERHADVIKWDNNSIKPIPLEFNSMPGGYIAIKEDFIVAELNNSVRFFHVLFGDYPYQTFGAAFHPYGFGQGFATMLMIPNTDRASKYTYSFMAHETAHQWWGNIVAWRSYRDQWLSEGFAEYSGVLYTALRENPKAAMSLVDDMRREIKGPPITLTGIGKGKLNDVGPIILGHRLNTSKSFGTYQALIYAKGGLVLRMLHFLFTNPGTGDDKAFYAMMKDFVQTYRHDVASTDDFRNIANKHFVNTPIAQKYGLKDLNWFFNQWVYNTELPSYRLEYQITDVADGVEIKGNVIQENAGEKWFMPLPLVFKFAGGTAGKGTVAAYGPKQAFSIKLPKRPEKVELDPDKWVLSEKTESK